MSFITIFVISVLVGFVAAGFVWYGWNIVENLLALRTARKAMVAPPSDEQETG